MATINNHNAAMMIFLNIGSSGPFLNFQLFYQ